MRLFPAKKTAWQKKQELASPSRFYGDNGTIHNTTVLDVETYNGRVVAVWFRCQQIAFEQTEVGQIRAAEMTSSSTTVPQLTGIQVTRVAS